MKKLILSGVVMFTLMSFTTKNDDGNDKCFEKAGELADAHAISYPNTSYEGNHAVFEYWYDFCVRFDN